MRPLLFRLAALLFMEALYLSIVVPLLPSYRFDLGASSAELGFLVAGYPAGLLLGGALTIRLARRVSVRPLVLAGGIMLAGASVPFGFVHELNLLIGLRLVQGLGGALIFAGSLAWLTEVIREATGETIGRLIRWTLAGTIAGPLVGTLAAATDLGAFFAALAILELGLALLVVGDRLPQPPAASRGRHDPIGVRQAAVLAPAMPILVVGAALIGGLEVVFPLRMADAGVGSGVIGVAFGASAAVEVSLARLTGRLADVRGPHMPIRAGLLLAVFVTLAMYVASAPLVLAVLLVGVGIALSLTLIPVMAWMSEESKRRGVRLLVTWSLINIVGAAAAFIGSSGAGVLIEVVGDGATLVVMSGMCAAGLVAVRRGGSLATKLVPPPDRPRASVRDARS